MGMKKSTAVLFFLNIGSILGGAFVFRFLERDQSDPEDSAVTDITTLDVFRNFLERNPSVSASDLAAFAGSVLEARDNGSIVGNDTATEERARWSLHRAIFFTLTVVTTIGFGHMTPVTNAGKLFFVAYALAAIPLFLALLAKVGQILRIPLKKLHRSRRWCVEDKWKDHCIKSFVVLVVGTVLLLCLTAEICVLTDGWDFLSSVYFAATCYTTVGFGDYVPIGAYERGPFILFPECISIVLLIGLSWVALLVSEVSALYQAPRSHGRSDVPLKPSTSTSFMPLDRKEDEVR